MRPRPDRRQPATRRRREAAPALLCGAALLLLLLVPEGLGSPPGVAPSDPPAKAGGATATAAARPALGSPPPSPSVGPGAVDWPQYMGSPEHLASNRAERTIAPSNVSRLGLEWSVPTNLSDRSAPILVGSTVYFGSWNGFEYAVNASTGAVNWETFLGWDPDCYPGGIESTPAFSDGSLFLGAPNGSWDALNASTGAVEWTYFAGAPSEGYYNWASALTYRGELYFGTSSCDDHPLIAGQLFEVNLTGGPTAHHTWNATPDGELGTTLWTVPTVDPGTNTLWVATGNDAGTPEPYAQSIVALNASTLTVLGSWQVPEEVGNDSDFGSTPTLVDAPHGTPLVVVTNKNGWTYAFNRTDVTSVGRSPVWSTFTGGGLSGATSDGTTVFVGGARGTDPGSLVALDPSTGSVVRDTVLPTGRPADSLTYANGLVFVGGGGVEYAVNAANGTVMWTFAAPGGEVIDGESVVADGRLFVPAGYPGTGPGALYAFGLPLAAAANASILYGPATPQGAFAVGVTGGMVPYHLDWDFDDGGRASGGSVLHDFRTNGRHWARVVAADAAGDIVEQNLTVDVDPPLVANVSGSPAGHGCGPTPPPFQFVANVTGGDEPYTVTWEFGDATPTAMGFEVLHQFVAPGAHDVRYSASDSGGTVTNGTVAVVAISLPCPTSPPPSIPIRPDGTPWGGALVPAGVAIVVPAVIALSRRGRTDAS